MPTRLDDHPALGRFTTQIPVLGGQGFVQLLDVMGDDAAIVEAARVSTGKGRSKHQWAPKGDGGPGMTRYECTLCGEWVGTSWGSPADGTRSREHEVCIEGDRRFLRYLMRHRHTSPFEACEIKLRIRMPIFVARQWIRHRTANVNEYSGRYSEMIDECFTVAPNQWRGQGTKNKQGSAGTVTEWPTKVPQEEAGLREPALNLDCTPGDYLSARQAYLQDHAREVYEERLAFGVSKELARVDLPVGNMTEWIWKIDLHNLIHFLSLRLDSHAQEEIRVYAEVIRDIVATWVPLAWEAARDWRVEAVTLSKGQIEAVRALVARLRAAESAQTTTDILRESGLIGGPPSEIEDFLTLIGLP